MRSLIKKVQNTIFQYKLLDRGSKIILAVSGGPDSVTMLDIFYRLQKKSDLELIIAHVNYGLRGKDSDGDEKLVRDLAKKYGLKIFVLTPEPRARLSEQLREPRSRKTPSENELRDIRYAFFEKVRQENNFDLIAVAHNANDQVETFLMRIIRGAGLQGMSAMQYKNGTIIRPLLATTRNEIEKYLKEKKLIFRIDKTNLESKYLRNKIRNKLIPYLEKDFNPQIKKTIFSSMESITEDLALLSQLTDETYGKSGNLKISNIQKLPPAIQKRVIRKTLNEKKVGLKDIGSAHINEIMKIIDSTKNKRQKTLFKGLKIERSGDKLIIDKI